MMKTVFAAVLTAGLGLVGMQAAHAAPGLGSVTGGNDLLVQVEGGCGPYGHRDGYGYCRPNRPPPPYRRFCPPGMHMTPYGCRYN